MGQVTSELPRAIGLVGAILDGVFGFAFDLRTRFGSDSNEFLFGGVTASCEGISSGIPVIPVKVAVVAGVGAGAIGTGGTSAVALRRSCSCRTMSANELSG